MKKLLLSVMSLILCSTMLYSCNGSKGVPKGMKAYEVVFARGYYLTEEPGYKGNSDEAQEHISTQKFTEDTLPVGSKIRVADGCECRMLAWNKFPAEGEAKTVSGEIKIKKGFWENIEYCAFDFLCSDDDFFGKLQVYVPGNAADRRTMTWNDDETLSILTVGNSFSDDAMEYVWDIAKSAGIKNVILGNLYYGACRLEWHYNYWTQNKAVYDYRVNTGGTWSTTKNATSADAFKTCEWDFISFQESAQEIQTKESLYKHLGDMVDMAKSRCPNAKILWHTPWVNTHQNYGNSIDAMFRDCMTATRQIVENYPEIDEIVTTGVGIQNARTSHIPAGRYLRDGWHLSLNLGRYIAGLTFFTQVTGISVAELDYAPAGLSKEFKKIALESAENARLNPRMVMVSQYTEEE